VCVVEYFGVYAYAILGLDIDIMRISAFFVPCITMLAGIGGFYLRLSERLNVIDSLTGLPERNAATTVWLIVLSMVVMLFIILFAIRVAAKHKALPGFESAFGTDPSAYPILFVIIGLVWLVGTYLYLTSLLSNNAVTVIDVYFMIFSALSAASVAFFAIEMYQDSRRNAPYALSIVPTVFMCFWLIFVYRQNASNPILISYIYQVLAIVASALSFYFTSGFLYRKPAPGRAIVTYYAAIYFCIITLADDHPIGIKLIFGALIAANLIHSTMLVKNLQIK